MSGWGVPWVVIPVITNGEVLEGPAAARALPRKRGPFGALGCVRLATEGIDFV
jgi:hypothetical protein